MNLLQIGSVVFDPQRFAAIFVTFDFISNWQEEQYCVMGHIEGGGPIYLAGPFPNHNEALTALNRITEFLGPAMVTQLHMESGGQAKYTHASS